MIASLLRQNDVATSFWRNNDVIIASSARWVELCLRCHNKCMIYTFEKYMVHFHFNDYERPAYVYSVYYIYHICHNQWHIWRGTSFLYVSVWSHSHAWLNRYHVLYSFGWLRSDLSSIMSIKYHVAWWFAAYNDGTICKPNHQLTCRPLANVLMIDMKYVQFHEDVLWNCSQESATLIEGSWGQHGAHLGPVGPR